MSKGIFFMHDGQRYMLMICRRSRIWKYKLASHFSPSLDAYIGKVTPADFIQFARSRSADGHNIEYLMLRWKTPKDYDVIMKTTRPKDFYTEAAAAMAALLHGATGKKWDRNRL